MQKGDETWETKTFADVILLWRSKRDLSLEKKTEAEWGLSTSQSTPFSFFYFCRDFVSGSNYEMQWKTQDNLMGRRGLPAHVDLWELYAFITHLL